MNEVEAAFGLLQLKHIDKALDERKAIYQRYCEMLDGLEGLTFVDVPADVSWNHAYFPVLIEPHFGMSRDGVYELFKADAILTRRYFYPLISSFAMYRGFPTSAEEHLPVANDIAGKVLCLPIYPGMTLEEQDRVVNALKRASLVGQAQGNEPTPVTEIAV